MILAPAKSCSLGYIITKDRTRCGLESNFFIGDDPIPIIGLDASIKYLGSPIAARKVSKIKSSSEIIQKFQDKVQKVFDSNLLEVQKLHALRTFLIPTLDFALINGQLKAKHLTKMDSLIGSHINKMIGGAVPNAVKHGSWKDGGLSIPSLTEKAHTGKVKSLIWMLTNKDALIKSLILTAVDDERKMRRIGIENDPKAQWFFNWKHEEPGSEHPGTNSIVQRARYALNCLDLTLTENPSDSLCHPSSDNPIPSELPTCWKLHDNIIDKEVSFSSPKNISLFLCTRRRDRWKKLMCNDSFHLHSMYSFDDNPITNEFLIRQNWPIQDNIFNFAMRSRLNMLPTPQFDEIINGKDHVFCPLCLSQGNQCIQSLAHILNGCVGKYRYYTARHNKVLDIIGEFLKSRDDVVELYKDKALHIDDLPSELSGLRPDIVAWSNERTKCILVEIGVPYATHNMHGDKLEEVYSIKSNKYLPICNHLRSKGIAVEHYTVIVSSLGAVYKESLKELKSLVRFNTKAFKTLIKRISMNALIGSMDVWQSNGPKHTSKKANDNAEEEDQEEFLVIDDGKLLEEEEDVIDDQHPSTL